MAITSASAVWKGNLVDGSGVMKLPKGAYEGPYTRASRFETGPCTNPEELIGAAHAGCYSMFLSAILSKSGFPPAEIRTTATVHLGDGPTITLIELDTEGNGPKDLVKVFALMGGKSVRGRGVAGLVNAGFESTYAADTIGELELAQFLADTERRLRGELPPFVSVNPFLDLTPMADDALFEFCIEAVLDDPAVDSLFISIVPHTVMLHTQREEMNKDHENIAFRIIRQSKRADKPIVVSVNAGTMYNPFIEALKEGGVPTFTTAERAMMALNRLVHYRLKKKARIP